MPTLQQLNIAQPQPATARLQAMEYGDRFKRTGLLERQVGLQEDSFEETKKHNASIELIKGYDFAAKNAKSEEDFKRLVKEVTGKDTEVKFTGQDVDGLEVLGSDGKTYKMYGPKNIVFDAVNAISNDPSWLTDPNKRQQTMTHLKQSGVTIVPTKESEKDKPQSTIGKLQYDFNAAKTAKERKEIQSKIDKEIKSEVGDDEGKKAASVLRKEFTKQSDTYVTVRDAHNRVEAAAKDPSAAGDLALIFNYMKVLDPGSVVREGEFANAENSGSIPQRIWAKYNKVMMGERLAPEQRDDFVDRSRRLYEGQEKTQKQLEDQYKRLAESYKANLSDVIINYLPESNLKIKDEMGLSHKPAKTVEELINKYPFLKE